MKIWLIRYLGQGLRAQFTLQFVPFLVFFLNKHSLGFAIDEYHNNKNDQSIIQWWNQQDEEVFFTVNKNKIL
jgi:hypothetical protein